MRNNKLFNIVEAELRKTVTAYMNLCDRKGIAWADFYVAVKAERNVPPICDAAALFRRAWVRVNQVVSN